MIIFIQVHAHKILQGGWPLVSWRNSSDMLNYWPVDPPLHSVSYPSDQTDLSTLLYGHPCLKKQTFWQPRNQFLGQLKILWAQGQAILSGLLFESSFSHASMLAAKRKQRMLYGIQANIYSNKQPDRFKWAMHLQDAMWFRGQDIATIEKLQ